MVLSSLVSHNVTEWETHSLGFLLIFNNINLAINYYDELTSSELLCEPLLGSSFIIVVVVVVEDKF